MKMIKKDFHLSQKQSAKASSPACRRHRRGLSLAPPVVRGLKSSRRGVDKNRKSLRGLSVPHPRAGNPKSEFNILKSLGPSYAPFQSMTGARPDVCTLLPEEQWEFLFQKTLRFAQYQIDRLSWRGEPGGILPDGFDANSIAAQAIMDWLVSHSGINPGRASEARSSSAPIPPSNDSTLQHCNDLTLSQHEINRFVLRHVTRLHHRKENLLVRNGEDLIPVQDMDDELVSVLELIPALDTPPDDSLFQKESLLRVHELKTRFELFLAKDRPLVNLFELGWDGISKPQTVASHLKSGVRTVENLRKRLQRSWSAFRKARR